MAKNIGLIQIKGTLGGMTFYQSGGQSLIKVANGPSKDRILKDKAFQRTRENFAEFGGSATVGKALRTSLLPVIGPLADRLLTGRVLKLFKVINARGTGLRGQRSITLSANRELIQGLEFNDQAHLDALFQAPFTATNAANRSSANLTIPPFEVATYVNFPVGATHFRLVHALGVVSDYVYNSETTKYEPLEPVLNTLGAVSYSDYASLAAGTPITFSLDAKLPGTPTMDPDVSVVQCLGIEFFQQIASIQYPLSQGSALRVVRAY